MRYRYMIIIFSFLACWYQGITQEPIVIHSAYATDIVKEQYGDVPLQFLTEEINKRVKSNVEVNVSLSESRGQIVLMGKEDEWPDNLNQDLNAAFPLPMNDEGYRIIPTSNRIYIQARSQRGLQYGIGQVLRESLYGTQMTWKGTATSQTPEKAIRGHQIGYRNTANSYDAWTVDVYEQYIRDMIVFGANSIENIPFSDPVPIHFTISADSMNVALARLCDKYDMDYWVWTPISFDLNDKSKTEKYLQDCESLYQRSPRLDAVFVPGGDPGNNPPELVLPMMEKMAAILQKYHPEAGLWLSMQGFEEAESDFVYDYMRDKSPDWMGGLVAGPSSPPLVETREALPTQYQLRHYPDITHTVRCQYPNWWWDPAFNFTLGREPVNPQPLRYHNIFQYTAPYTDGFITYSDGMHDDFNKMIWSRLGWTSIADIREVTVEYANYFLHSKAAATIADGLFGLEQNWDGPIKYNGSIQATKILWESIDKEFNLSNDWRNWRWKMYLMRAQYDAFIQERFRYEEGLEKEANMVMLQAENLGAQVVLDSVQRILGRSADHFKDHEGRNQIYHLADDLFEVIGFQPSVPLYQASNPERGAVIDFIDRPLNNEWWILSEFEKMKDWSEEKKINRLEEMGRWESAGEGGYYDDIGNVYKSPHVVKLQAPATDPLFQLSDNPGFDWWDSGYNKSRLSWMSSMGWPHAMEYHHLDPDARYTLKLSGVGDAFPIIQGQEIKPTQYSKETGEIKVFPIPQKLTQSGTIRITFRQINEDHLNWRQHSRLNEAWLIKD